MKRFWPAPVAVRLGARSTVLPAALATFLIAAYLRLSDLGEGGLGNPFYAAAVRSMGKSFHNFFFASFDPLGTFSVDKPPLALWLQTGSAFVFGYGGFALALPQAVAGIGATVVLFFVARRLHGEFFALTAALVLAVLPASVLVSRNNTMDTLVMALSLGQVALVMMAIGKPHPPAPSPLAERGRVEGRALPLLAAGVLAGLAFNTKGFEAFVALPAVLAFFWFGSVLSWRRRLAHLAGFGVVAAAVGLSWITAVSLFPGSERPLILNSDGNSIWDLTFRYNGLDRIFGGEGFNPANALTTTVPNIVPIGVLYGGERGPLRVFGEFPGPLIGAVLPAALAGAVLFVVDLGDASRRASAVLWLLWLAAGLAAFSASRLGSPHYLEAFSPALAACTARAALSAAGDSSWRRLVALAGAAGSAWYVLDRFGALGGAGSFISALAIVSLVGTGLALVLTMRGAPGWSSPLFVVPFACLLAVCFAVSFQAIRDAPVEGVQPGLVLLSEDKSREVPFDASSPAYSFLTGRYDYLSRPLSYVKRQAQPSVYAIGVRTFYMAAALISQYDLNVLPLYSEFRNRPEAPLDRLQALIQGSEVRFFLVSPGALSSSYASALSAIQAACPDNVSRAAGLAPQTGLLLLQCR